MEPNKCSRNSRNESLPQSMELGEGTNQAGS